MIVAKSHIVIKFDLKSIAKNNNTAILTIQRCKAYLYISGAVWPELIRSCW